MRRFQTLIGRLAIAGALIVLSAAGQTPTPTWIDDAEKSLVESMVGMTSPAERIESLNTWTEQYPESQFSFQRDLAFLVAYQELGNLDGVAQSIRSLVQREQLRGAYFACTVGPNTANPNSAVLELVAQAAGVLQTQFGLVITLESSGLPFETFLQLKSQGLSTAFKALGWVATQRQDFRAAETAYTNALKQTPTDAEISLLLAVALGQQKDSTRSAEVLHHMARAGSYDGPGGLRDEQRSQVAATVTKSLRDAGFDSNYIESLMRTAKFNPMPVKETTASTSPGQPQPASQQVATSQPERYTPPPSAPAIEPFEQYYQRHSRGSWIEDFANGMLSSSTGQPFQSKRDRLYQQWLAEQYLKLQAR